MKKYSLILIGVILLIGIIVFPSCYIEWLIKKDTTILGEQSLKKEELLFPDTDNEIYSALLMMNGLLDSEVDEMRIDTDAECEPYLDDIFFHWECLSQDGLCPVLPYDRQNETFTYSVIRRQYAETVFHKYTCEIMEISMENERVSLNVLYDAQNRVYYKFCVDAKAQSENNEYIEKINHGIDGGEALQILFGQEEKDHAVAVKINEHGEVEDEESVQNSGEKNGITIQQIGEDKFTLVRGQKNMDVCFKTELLRNKVLYELYIE